MALSCKPTSVYPEIKDSHFTLAFYQTTCKHFPIRPTCNTNQKIDQQKQIGLNRGFDNVGMTRARHGLKTQTLFSVGVLVVQDPFCTGNIVQRIVRMA